MPHDTFRSQTLRYLAISIATFLVLQALTVILHEFTHSTMAWALGEIQTPMGIVWGNPLTMTGWDEGVDYGRLFAQGHTLHAALIGFSPLLMHTCLVGLGLFFMRRQWLVQRKWVFHITYWLVVASFMELVAYVFMRAFSGHGDIGILDRAMNISPWWVFVIGSMLLTWGLLIFFRDATSRLQALFAPNNPAAMWGILTLASFLIFLWGSGIRVMAYVSGPQWLFGTIGIPACILTVTFFRPDRLGRDDFNQR